MRILHYYWSQFNDNFRKGGGIKVYLNNILPFQVNAGNEVFMLNSGVDYSFLRKDCHIEHVGDKNGIHQFTIFNSPIMAPSKADFYGQQEYIKNEKLKSVVDKFITLYGPFDVIHFHSLEGLSLSVLELKKKYSETQFIYSMHNYFPFCPQVNLWKNDYKNCSDFHDGKDCIHCVGVLPNKQSIQMYYQGITLMKRWGMEKAFSFTMKKAKAYYKKLKKDKQNLTPPQENNSNRIAENFLKFREENIRYFNTYIDKVLCVSQRVKVICQNMGINPELMRCIYIGTDFAKKQEIAPKYDIYKSPFQIAYIGYMRRDKGFYFFLEALRQMQVELAENIVVVVAAKNEDSVALSELLSLKNKFADIQYNDGYTKNNIRSILTGTQLGIVPVMWEDNLPQVSMELKAMGIPVFSSDLGGASELSNCMAFKFRGGEIYDFLHKLKIIVDNRDLLNKYYEEGRYLNNIEEHCRFLEAIYQKV